MSEEIVFTRNTSGLVRELSWIDVFAISIPPMGFQCSMLLELREYG
jgi:hypothetical protein